MKNRLKYLFAIILTVILVSTSAVCSSAEGIETENISATQEAEAESNFFSAAYEEITEYASEILCAMTLAASLILAFAYKKGLLPLVQSALMSIGNAVTKIKESTKESEEKAERFEEDLKSNISAAGEALNRVTEKISSLDLSVNEKLLMDKKAREEYKELKLVVGAQIDMLYDIFMSSALPQYQKDAVGERIGKMREAMAKDDTDN